MRVTVILLLFGICTSVVSAAQSVHNAHQTLRLTLGGGGAIAPNPGGGAAGLAQVQIFRGNWGLALRATAYQGRDASEERCFFGCYTPTEEFSERALLLSRRFALGEAQYSVGAGPGLVRGQQLDPTGEFIYDFEEVSGIAYEIGVSTTSRYIGFGATLHGNVNFEAFLSGVSGFIYLGL